MTIGIDTSPLKTGHKFRGTGSYTENLIKALKKYDRENQYLFFNRGEKYTEKLDLIHYPYFEPFFLTLPIRKPLSTVVTVHDLTPLVYPSHFPHGLKGEIKWQLQKWSLKGAKAVIVDSLCSQQDVAQYTGISPEKIFTVYLAAGEEFRPLKNKKRIEEIIAKYHLPEKFVLYVGDATWNKNLPGLIKAVQKINVPLVIVGKQLADSHFDRLNPWNRDLIKAEELTQGDKRIFKLGFVSKEELTTIYNMATLCALPSFYEGFGLPVLEAMSCGCPVLTAKNGSLEEVGGKAVFYINPQDLDGIANGIGEIYFNPKLREKFSKLGYLQAHRFSWEKTARETVKVYKKALSKN